MKRPVLVWIICIYIMFTKLISIVSIGAVFVLPSDETTWAANWYLSQPWWVVAYLVINSGIWITAGIYLFLMRRAAFALFIIATVFGLTNLIWQTFDSWVPESAVTSLQEPTITASLIVGFAIILSMLGYVWSLKKKELLI